MVWLDTLYEGLTQRRLPDEGDMHVLRLKYGKRVVFLKFRYVDLNIRVPVCGNQKAGYECRLPPGHENGDVPCIGVKISAPKFRVITRVTVS